MVTEIKEKKEVKKEITFMTPVTNFRIWIKPDYFEMAGPMRIAVKGRFIDFDSDGKYVTSEKEIIDFLRKHPWYNMTGRFYEVMEE